MKKLLVASVCLLTLAACGGAPSTPKSISGTVSITNAVTNLSAPHVPNQVLVKFKNTLTAQTNRLSVAGATLQNLRSVGLENTRLFASSSSDLAATITALQARADVVWAQPNYILQASAVPNDQFYGLQWHYSSISLPLAWDIETGATNPVTVAVPRILVPAVAVAPAVVGAVAVPLNKSLIAVTPELVIINP